MPLDNLFSRRLALFLLFLQLAREHGQDLAPFVIAAKPAHCVRHDRLFAVRAGNKLFWLQGQMTAAAALVPFCQMMSWYCHSKNL